MIISLKICLNSCQIKQNIDQIQVYQVLIGII